MGERSAIQWTNRSWNPWQGCAKVSAGCADCYMFRDKKRYGQDPETVVRSKPATFNAPFAWERAAAGAEREDMVFTCSWSDWFIRDADPWRDEAWAIIRATPHLTYQILTKRHARIADHLPSDWGDGYPNVWIGVSIEDQATAEQRIPLLLSVPAVVRFLSCEPMLGPVALGLLGTIPKDIAPWSYMLVRDRIDWVIFGGESGGMEARRTDPAWIAEGVRECREADVAAFVKQLGSPWAREHKARDSHGGDPAEWPESLRVREFPR